VIMARNHYKDLSLSPCQIPDIVNETAPDSPPTPWENHHKLPNRFVNPFLPPSPSDSKNTDNVPTTPTTPIKQTSTETSSEHAKAASNSPETPPNPPPDLQIQPPDTQKQPQCSVGSSSHRKNSNLHLTPPLPYSDLFKTTAYPPKPASVSVPQTPLAPPHPFLRSKSLSSIRSNTDSSGNLNRFTRNYILPVAKWAYSPASKKKRNERPPYKIEYSVFKPLKSIPPVQSEKQFIILWRKIVQFETGKPFDFPENYISPAEFANLLESIVESVEVEDIRPERVAQGSSGSYFILNRKRNSSDPNSLYRAGIFKPKDEEPYGPLSPKWTKWLHRTLFPCFFGRSCLIPNLGYISEVAASVLDRQLLSYIVPYTEIIHLRSPTFYYSYFDRSEDLQALPLKIGSFQMFLEGYTIAADWFKLYPLPTDLTSLPQRLEIDVEVGDTDLDSKFVWSRSSLEQFREQLEKLVILDYIMRNTDRGLDNWMIKIEWDLITKSDKLTYRPRIKIGAIDSGLAFPWKRPDEWRSFPFGWLFLPLAIIGQPFSRNTRKTYLSLLTSKWWWEQTITQLREVFEKDNDFKERLWLQQVAVLKGQAFNVVEILKLSYAGPLELVRREDLYVWDDAVFIPDLDDGFERLPEWDTPNYTDYDENTPLIRSEVNGRPMSTLAEEEDICSTTQPISGYDYTVIHEHDRHDNKSSCKAIIERLEKGNSKPPVFTWC